MRWEVTRDARRGCLKLLYTPLYIKVHVYICGDILVFTWHLPSLHSWREHQLYTLGHGSTTRTRAFIDATPKQERSPEAHAHTHTTTLSDECVAPGPSGSAPPLPLAGLERLASASFAVSESSPHPTPPLFFPRISLRKRRGRGDAHSMHPRVEREMRAPRRVRGSIMRTEEA